MIYRLMYRWCCSAYYISTLLGSPVYCIARFGFTMTDFAVSAAIAGFYISRLRRLDGGTLSIRILLRKESIAMEDCK